MLQASTFTFLKNLTAHNDKAWFDEHRKQYEAAKKDLEAFVEALRKELLPLIPELEEQKAKDLIFRIFRDVRFAKDKRPYKEHFGVYFCKGGKKSADAGYYLHIQPGGSFLAAGSWMPEAPQLKAIRQEIDYNLDTFEGILKEKTFSKYFKKLEGERLKTVPQGYATDNPAIEYLKQKSFLSSHAIDDKVLLAEDAVKKCGQIFKAASPLVKFLNSAAD